MKYKEVQYLMADIDTHVDKDISELHGLLREGMEDYENGRMIPFDTAMEDIRGRYSLQN